MAYEKVFEKPYPGGWKDSPDTTTPILADIMDDYDTAITHIENHLDGTTAIFPIQATGGMTQPVGVDANGNLFTYPGGESWSKLLDVRDETSQTANQYTLSDSILNYTEVLVKGYYVYQGRTVVYSGTFNVDSDLVDSTNYFYQVGAVSCLAFSFSSDGTVINQEPSSASNYIYQVFAR